MNSRRSISSCPGRVSEWCPSMSTSQRLSVSQPLRRHSLVSTVAIIVRIRFHTIMHCTHAIRRLSPLQSIPPHRIYSSSSQSYAKTSTPSAPESTVLIGSVPKPGTSETSDSDSDSPSTFGRTFSVTTLTCASETAYLSSASREEKTE